MRVGYVNIEVNCYMNIPRRQCCADGLARDNNQLSSVTGASWPIIVDYAQRV